MSKESAKNKTISAKLEAFEKLVAWFDTDDFSLEKALEKFKLAEALADEIEGELDGIKNSVEVLKTKFDQPDA